MAQERIELLGKIVDNETNEPLFGANIYFESNWRYGTISGLDGKFVLKIPTEVKNISIIISFIGYKQQKINITNITEKISVRLIANSTELEEVIIKAKRIIAEEFTIKQIKKLDIYVDPAAKADALLAVNAMPSATTIDESASVSLRGSSPAETGIFLNEVPVYDAVKFSQLNGIGTFSIFNTDIIERLHVFPGNPPLEFGNTTSGLVSIQTEDYIPETSNKSIGISLANFGGSYKGKLSNHTALTIFLNHQPSSIIKHFNKKALEDLKEFHNTDLGLNFTHYFDKKTSIKVFNYTNSEGYKFNLKYPSFSGTFNQNKNRNFTIGNFLTQLKNAEISINNGFSYSKTEYKFGNLDSKFYNTDLYLSANYHHFFDKFSIKTGLSYDSRYLDMQLITPQNPYAYENNHPVLTLDTIYYVIIPEIYTYFKFKPNEKITIGSGIRKNITEVHNFSYLSKQLNINYRFNKTNSLNLSIGEYHKINIPNSKLHDITQFRSQQLSTDYKHKTRRIELNTSLFFKNTFHNNLENKIYGAEIFFKYNIPSTLSMDISYTFLESSIKADNINYAGEYDIDYFIKGSLKYLITETFNISSIFLYRQGTYYSPVISSNFNNELNIYEPTFADNESLIRLPDYSKIDFSVSKIFFIHEKNMLITFLSLNNVLNNKNVRQANYNNDYSNMFYEHYGKRTIYFGLVYNF